MTHSNTYIKQKYINPQFKLVNMKGEKQPFTKRQEKNAIYVDMQTEEMLADILCF